MDEQSCPRCKTTKYRNPSLKLMVNVCGHSLCENCVELLFVRGSGNCPKCHTALRRTNFRVQVFEDNFIEKEVEIRKRILKDFNKREEDFPTLAAYNDYLELIETLVFNLSNGIDIENTKKKIEMYRKEHKDEIMKNKSKLSRDEEYIEFLIEQEKELEEQRRQEIRQEEIKQKVQKAKKKEALIDDLMFSDLSAERILASHLAESAAPEEPEVSALPRVTQTQFSTGIKMGKQDIFLPMPKAVQGVLYQYTTPVMEMCGPMLPDEAKLLNHGFMNHIRAASEMDKGGGFEAKIACERALQDAFNGLFFTCDITPSPAPSSSSSEQSEMDLS